MLLRGTLWIFYLLHLSSVNGDLVCQDWDMSTKKYADKTVICAPTEICYKAWGNYTPLGQTDPTDTIYAECGNDKFLNTIPLNDCEFVKKDTPNAKAGRLGPGIRCRCDTPDVVGGCNAKLLNEADPYMISRHDAALAGHDDPPPPTKDPAADGDAPAGDDNAEKLEVTDPPMKTTTKKKKTTKAPGGLGTGAIVGISVGAVLGVVLIGGGIFAFVSMSGSKPSRGGDRASTASRASRQSTASRQSAASRATSRSRA